MPQAQLVTGEFYLIDYTTEAGNWRLHFQNNNPGPGMPTDYYIDVPDAAIPANINQNQLMSLLQQRLSYTVNQGFAPLNTFIATGAPVVI